ncbi:hypothetical protein KPATCC21470_8672 [Kitasatospora purpeofusca]
MAGLPSPVTVVDRSFGLLDAGVIPAGPVDRSTGLIVVMNVGARVQTGIHNGPVNVRATVLETRPGPDARLREDWSEIVEASISAPHGNLRVDSLADGPVPALPLLSPYGGGWYRVLVTARGRDTARDAVVEDPVEDYDITIWPEPPSPPRVLQALDDCGHSLRLTAARQPAQAPAPSTEPDSQAAHRANILRAMGGTGTSAPDEAARPWRPEPDRPAPRPPRTDRTGPTRTSRKNP